MTRHAENRQDLTGNEPNDGHARPQRIISYEGPIADDLREHDGSWRDELALPGDRVRMDGRATGDGLAALRARLGNGALEVSRTVVRGEERDNGLGGFYPAIVTEHEFKEIEGRFPCQHFQDEQDDELRYGAIIVRDGRMWFVPLGEDRDRPAITGAACEVAPTSGSSKVMASLTEAGSFFRGDAASGEFRFEARAFEQEGPVNLVGSSWMSLLAGGEERLAREAVIAAGGTETDPVAPSAIPARTLAQIDAIIASGKLQALSDKDLHDAATVVVEARIAREREGAQPDASLEATRDAIWSERAQRLVKAVTLGTNAAMEQARTAVDEDPRRSTSRAAMQASLAAGQCR